MRTRFTLRCLFALAWCLPAAADWDPGDPYKMHFPQLPDPQGWDVKAVYPKVLADDWQCTETGPVDDVHLWGSWRGDRVGVIRRFHLSIHANDPGPPSKPINPPLWERDFFPGEWKERQYGTGQQGWFNPNDNYYRKPDHLLYFQYNFTNLPEPFVQKRGTIYWLDVTVDVESPDTEWGWKTSRNQFMDAAVWADYPELAWKVLRDPITQQPLDMAFVITPEPTSVLLLLPALALHGRCRKARLERRAF